MRYLTVDIAGLKVKINKFTKGGQILGFGSLVAIDTETHLIDFSKPAEYPEVVVLTAYGGGEFVDLVMWEDIPEYLDRLLAMSDKTMFVFHNAPFDIGVLGVNRWVKLVDEERIWDTGLQFLLSCILRDGFRDEKEYPSLQLLAKIVLECEIEKSADVRCTFNRGTPVDDAHAIYACGDAIVTWKISTTLGVFPTIGIQVKGFLFLDRMTRNGINVNRKAMTDLRNSLYKKMDVEKEKLLAWGIKKDKDKSASQIYEWAKDLGFELPYSGIQQAPVGFLKLVLIALLEYANEPFDEFVATVNEKLAETMQSDNVEKVLSKESVNYSIEIAKRLPDIVFPTNKKEEPTQSKTQVANLIFYALDEVLSGKEEISIISRLYEEWESHGGWPVGYKEEGIVSVLQDLLKDAEQQLNIKLPVTDTGKYSTSEDALSSIDEDTLKRIPFLDSFKAYNHYEKLCSTYLNDKFIAADGRVHTRMCPLMSTGRTSSREPNLQNVAKDPGIREIYCASPGYVLVSCDYNQQELVALAQHCYTRYGKSRLRDVINADIDVHSFMASNIAGIFKGLPEFDVDNKKLTEEYKGRVEEFKETDRAKHKELRALSKALNFGYPGGLGAERFVTYAKGYGVTLSQKESLVLRNTWLKTFPEMEKHFEPEPMIEPGSSGLFKSITLTGRIRGRCPYCAALNTVFQGLSSDCSKTAGWEATKAGFFLVAFIHDELMAEIPYDKHMTARAHYLSEIMINSMQRFTPDVKVKAAPAAMFSWNKAADGYYDGDGDLVPWELVPKDAKGEPIKWDRLENNIKNHMMKEKYARFLSK